jgi:hypothetical protein
VLKGSGFDEFEVIEGTELRYSTVKNKKRETNDVDFITVADGVISLTFTNRGVLRSKLHIVVQRKPMQQNFSLSFTQDTITTVVKEKQQFVDTVAEMLVDNETEIFSTADITRNNKQVLKIPFVKDHEYIGWAYWLGAGNQSKQQMEAAMANQDIVTGYLKTELGKKSFLPLPEEKNQDLLYALVDSTQGMIRNKKGNFFTSKGLSTTYNTATNYAGFRIQDSTATPSALELRIENQSTLYNYKVRLKVVGLYLRRYEAEAERNIITYKDYIVLTRI